MGEHVTLYSSYPFSFEELSGAILAAKGEPLPFEERYGDYLLGRLEDGRHIIYIHGEHEPGDPVQFWEQEVYYLGEDLMNEIAAKLEGKPVVSIAMWLGGTARSEFLAVELAYHCAQRWPCVVRGEVVEQGEWKIKLYANEEIKRLRAEGKAFTAYYGTHDDEEE